MSEHVYCPECRAEIGRIGFLEKHPGFPIWCTQARGATEFDLWSNTIDKLAQMRACHPLRFAVIGEGDGHSAVLLVRHEPDSKTRPSAVYVIHGNALGCHDGPVEEAP